MTKGAVQTHLAYTRGFVSTQEATVWAVTLVLIINCGPHTYPIQEVHRRFLIKFESEELLADFFWLWDAGESPLRVLIDGRNKASVPGQFFFSHSPARWNR